MKVAIFNVPSVVDETELQTDILKLPIWRRIRVMEYRFHIDRVLCSKSYLMLLQTIEEIYGPIEDTITFEYGTYGKPFIREHPEIQFNLSHCHKGIICAVHESPVGCDIEEIPEQLDMELCKACFNKSEFQQIINSANPCTEFTKLWTMKEAFLKLSGLGLRENLQNLFTMDIANTVKISTTICENRGYVYSVAT